MTFFDVRFSFFVVRRYEKRETKNAAPLHCRNIGGSPCMHRRSEGTALQMREETSMVTNGMRRMFGKRLVLVVAMIACFGLALVAAPLVGAQDSSATPATTSACVRDGSGVSWRHPLRKLRLEIRDRDGRCDRVVLNEVAELTGQSNQQIVSGLRDGQSLAEIAETAGVTRDQLIDGITSAVSTTIDERVASGDVAPEQKAIWMNKLAANLDNIIDWHRGDHRDTAPSASTPGA
jgi:hypothetical protein